MRLALHSRRGASEDSMGAFRINALVALGPFSRAKLFRDIAAGRLVARKVGGATVVLGSDWANYIEGQPRRT